MDPCVLCDAYHATLYSLVVEDINNLLEPAQLTICMECMRERGLWCHTHDVEHLHVSADLIADHEMTELVCMCTRCCLDSAKTMTPEEVGTIVNTVYHFLTSKTVSDLEEGHEIHNVHPDVMIVYNIYMLFALWRAPNYQAVITALVQGEAGDFTIH